MTRVKSLEINQIIKLLKTGRVGIIPTDTIYGIVGSALIPDSVEKIYELRKRSFNKPMIILISDLNDLNQFNIKLTDTQKKFLQKNWPNPLSIVLPCKDDKFSYLHRGTNSLAFRMPKDERLLKILKQVGPLVAPSANLEGEKPAENINQAKKYFREKISFYIDGGEIKYKPSTLLELEENSVKILRYGDFQITSRLKQQLEKTGWQVDQD